MRRSSNLTQILYSSMAGVILLGAPCLADPSLVVSDLGLNGNTNREWLIEIAPDPTLFGPGGGSVSVELAFEITGTALVGATANDTAWPFQIPGNDPFTGGISAGLQVNLAADNVFASLGSDLFVTGDAVTTLIIETFGSGPTTLSWGGQTLLEGTQFAYVGSRINQAGIAFDGYQGSLSAGSGPDGDFNGDSLWNCTDIDALSGAIATASSDLSFDMNGDGIISLGDITDVDVGWLAVGGANNLLVTAGNPFIVGDANLDGSVDVSDFNQWNSNKFTASDRWCFGDWNADGSVDVSDFNLWNGNKFSASAGTLVPEPGIHVLLTWLGLWTLVTACRAR